MFKKFSRSTSFRVATGPGTEGGSMDPRRHEQPLGTHGPLQNEDPERKPHQKRRSSPDRRPSVDSHAADEPYSPKHSTARHINSAFPEDIAEVPFRQPGVRGIPGQFESRIESEDRGHSDYHGGRNTYPHHADDPHMHRHRSRATVNRPETYPESEGGYARGVGSDSKSIFQRVGKVGKRIKEDFYGEENDDAHLDRREREQYISDLQSTIKEKSRQIKELEERVRLETENSRKIKESANKMQYAMENKELFVGRQDSDKAVWERFNNLVNQIKNWSVHFAKQGKPQLKGEYSAPEWNHIRRVAPMIMDVQDFGKFLEARKNMRLFVRGYVGFAVVDNLFRSLPYSSHGLPVDFQGVDVWMHKQLAQPLSILERSLLYTERSKVSIREFHDWRVLTTTLISRLDTESKIGKGMEGHVTDCANQIMSLIGQWMSEDDRKALELDKGLQGILLSAVGLSKAIRCQRASWSVRHIDGASARDSQLLYDEAVMNDEEHREDDKNGEELLTSRPKLVEVVASPSLFKCGNSDGELFELESCLYKSEVKCG